MIQIRRFEKADLPQAIQIWNSVVLDGIAFPQTDTLNDETGLNFFESQTCTSVAFDTSANEIKGLYILHPNNIGRCAHICNASFAVKKGCRGCHIGEMLVKDCLLQAKNEGFGIMQFNAVVSSNIYAINLYQKLGFIKLGTVKDGFKLDENSYSDIILFYKTL